MLTQANIQRLTGQSFLFLFYVYSLGVCVHSLLLKVFDSAVSDICWSNTVKAHQICSYQNAEQKL